MKKPKGMLLFTVLLMSSIILIIALSYVSLNHRQTKAISFSAEREGATIAAYSGLVSGADFLTKFYEIERSVEYKQQNLNKLLTGLTDNDTKIEITTDHTGNRIFKSPWIDISKDSLQNASYRFAINENANFISAQGRVIVSQGGHAKQDGKQYYIKQISSLFSEECPAIAAREIKIRSKNGSRQGQAAVKSIYSYVTQIPLTAWILTLNGSPDDINGTLIYRGVLNPWSTLKDNRKVIWKSEKNDDWDSLNPFSSQDYKAFQNGDRFETLKLMEKMITWSDKEDTDKPSNDATQENSTAPDKAYILDSGLGAGDSSNLEYDKSNKNWQEQFQKFACQDIFSYVKSLKPQLTPDFENVNPRRLQVRGSEIIYLAPTTEGKNTEINLTATFEEAPPVLLDDSLNIFQADTGKSDYFDYLNGHINNAMSKNSYLFKNKRICFVPQREENKLELLIDGDMILDGSIIICTGNLTVKGNIRGNGVVMALGNIIFYPNNMMHDRDEPYSYSYAEQLRNNSFIPSDRLIVYSARKIIVDGDMESGNRQKYFLYASMPYNWPAIISDILKESKFEDENEVTDKIKNALREANPEEFEKYEEDLIESFINDMKGRR